MRAYEARRGVGETLLGGGLRQLAAEIFGSSSQEGDRVVVSFGALRTLRAWTDGKTVWVETEMDSSVDTTIASDTIRRYNAFLERATGYTAKQRGKREQQRAKASG